MLFIYRRESKKKTIYVNSQKYYPAKYGRDCLWRKKISQKQQPGRTYLEPNSVEMPTIET